MPPPPRTRPAGPPFPQMGVPLPSLRRKKEAIAVKIISKGTGMQEFGNYVLAFLIFCIYSRILDRGLSALRLPLLMSVTVLAIAFISGTVMDRLGKMGYFMYLMAFWIAIGTPFGYSRAQSLETVLEIFKSLLVFTGAAALIASVKQSRRVMFGLACSSLVAAMLGATAGELRGGRLQMESGTLGDPNAYAMFLLLGLPQWWFFARRAAARKKTLLRLFYLSCTLPILAAFAKTGSRGGMTAVAVMLLVIFLQMSFMKKLQMIALGAVCVAGLWVTLPPYLKARYFTLFAPKDMDKLSQDEAADLAGSAESSEERRRLLLNSLLATVKNPIFGVGAGGFPAYADAEAKKVGRRTHWQPTHNSWTELSSEAGIPALVLFILAIVSAFRAFAFILNTKPPIMTPEWLELMDAARYLRLSLISTMVCCSFLNFAYRGVYQPLLGMIAGILSVAGTELARSRKMAADAAAKAAAAPKPALLPKARPGPRMRSPWPAPGRA